MCACVPVCFQRNLVTFAKARPAQMIFITTSYFYMCVCVDVLFYYSYITVIRGEPERAPNTRVRGTGSGFICIYTCMYVCGVIISVRRELNFERIR